MNKASLLLALVFSLLSLQAMAQEEASENPIVTVTCLDSASLKKVEFTYNQEDGESSFTSYAKASPVVGVLYHIESEPDAMEVKGAFMEAFGITENEEPIGRLSLINMINVSETEIKAEGIFTYADGEEDKTLTDLACTLLN